MYRFVLLLLLPLLEGCAEEVNGDFEKSQLEPLAWQGCIPSIVEKNLPAPLAPRLRRTLEEHVARNGMKVCYRNLDVAFSYRIEQVKSDSGLAWALFSAGFLPGTKKERYEVDVEVSRDGKALQKYSYKGHVRTVYGLWAFAYAGIFPENVYGSCGGSCAPGIVPALALQRFAKDARLNRYFDGLGPSSHVRMDLGTSFGHVDAPG